MAFADTSVSQISAYAAHCIGETNEQVCPISQEDLIENSSSHPRKRIFISHSKDSKSIPYNVEDFKEWVSYQEEKGEQIRIPHCGITVSSSSEENIKNRVKFHLEALERYPDMTYNEVSNNGSIWVNEYIDKIKRGDEDDNLRSKINYFCDVSHFSPRYLLDQSETKDNSDLRGKAEDMIHTYGYGSYILRGSSIVNTSFVKNYVFSVKNVYEDKHIPFRHRYGHGYFRITRASRFSTVSDTFDNFIGSGILDVFDYGSLDLKDIICIE